MDIVAASTKLLSEKLLEIILPTFATALAGLATAVLVKLLKKIGLDVDEKERAALKSSVRDAVLAVEEQARQTPVRLPGEAKREIAADIVKRELPKADRADINFQIHAVLPEIREQLGQPSGPRPDSPGTFGR
jgi:hypothetical protein